MKTTNLILIAFLFCIFFFSEVNAQVDEKEDWYSIRVSQGISRLFPDNEILLSSKEGPNSLITFNYTNIDIGKKFGKNEAGISMGKNSYEVSEYFIYRIHQYNTTPQTYDTLYNIGSKYVTSNYLGVYYSREIIKNLSAGIRAVIPTDRENSDFITEYYSDYIFESNNLLDLSAGIAFSAKNNKIFDFVNYKSKAIMLKIGIGLKL